PETIRPQRNKCRERKCSRRVLFRVDAIQILGRSKRESAQVCDPRGSLLLHHFCLPVDNLAGEAVDGDMNPVMLFSFDNEIVLQTCRTWLEVTRLRDHVDQQYPSPGLCRVG